MPRTEKHLIQIQLSEAERRSIKTLAAGQGMTFRQAVLEAFAAWAEKLSNPPAGKQPGKTSAPVHPKRRSAEDPSRQAVSGTATPSPNWLKQAAKLDWTKCPEVEVLHGKGRRVWVLRGTLAPLAEVLQAVADRNPISEVAEVFGIELPQLTKVLKFAGALR